MNYYTIERKKGEPYVGTSIKYRLYPNKQQEKWLIDMGNKCRGAYNQLVKNYIEGKEAKEFPKTNMKSRTLLYNYLNTIEWLDDLPSLFKEDVVTSFLFGLERFYDYISEKKKKKNQNNEDGKKIGPPKIKKKVTELKMSSNNSTISRASFLNLEEGSIEIFSNILKRKNTSSKFSFVAHKKFDNPIIKRLSISRNSTQKWFISFNFELMGVKKEFKPRGEKKIGIDVGIKDMAITSDGYKFNVPVVKLKKLEDRIASLDVHISRRREINKKSFRSNNYIGLLKKRARLYEKMNNLKDQSHQHTTKILTRNEISQINVEDLKLSFMLQNKNLAKAVSRNAIEKFVTHLKSSSESKGIIFNKVNPRNTSKMCSVCGELNNNLKLSHRTWTCNSCGTNHDRDINAAKNIEKSLEIRN